MNGQVEHVIEQQITLAKRAIGEARRRLDNLEQILDGDNTDEKVFALVRWADLAGYSNSLGTACAEITAAAGAVNGLWKAGLITVDEAAR